MAAHEPHPLYLECSRSQALLAWCGAVANAVAIFVMGFWLVTCYGSVDPSVYGLIITIFLAIFISDLFSGFVHWAADSWFDGTSWTRVVSISREHHAFPHHIVGYPFRDYVAFSCWPTVLIIGPCGLVSAFAAPETAAVYYGVTICFIVSAVMFFGTYAHRLGHRRSCLRIVRLLQACHLLITTRHHGVHHRGDHDRRYCVINGWANYVCDNTGFWRGLECVVTQLTGSLPRSGELE